jgi:hypothetical protein
MRHWNFWEWVAYGCLFVAALIMAAETGFKTEPEVMEHLPAFFQSSLWGFSPAALVVLATIILFLREFIFKRTGNSEIGLAAASVPGAHPDAAPPTVITAPRLQITFGNDDKYEKVKAVSLYRSTRTFSVSVENQSRSSFVSNCKLYLEIINPKTSSPSRHLILDSFTLNPTETRLVDIVSYAEPTGSTMGGTNDRIALLMPRGGLASSDMWPWFLPIGHYVFTLIAVSRESEPCEVVCKTWVDDSFRLHLERA